MDKRRDRSSYQQDRARVEIIKRDFLDAYDKVVDEGFEPTLGRVLGRIPYLVTARFAQEIRRELVDSGDLPEPRRGGVPRPVVPTEHRRDVFYNDREAIAKKAKEFRASGLARESCLPDRSHLHREEMASRASAERRGEDVPAWDPSPEGPTDAAVAMWAIRRFRDAWRLIRGAKRNPRQPGPVVLVVFGDPGVVGLEVPEREGSSEERPVARDRETGVA